MPSYADKLLRQAADHQHRGQFADAESLYRKAAALEPANPAILTPLGRLLALTGRGPEAVDLLTRAASLRPNDPYALLDLSEACRAAARLDDALAHLRRATQLHPNFPEAHNNLGALYVLLGRDADAESSLSTALRLRPDHPETLVNFGNLRASQGRHAEAVAWYRQLLAASPNHAGALANLAAVYQETGLAAEALDAFTRALAAAPPTPALWGNYLLALNRAAGIPPADVLEAHRQFGRRFIQPHAPLRRPHTNSPDPDRRLKIGYVSSDLKRHSVAYFLEPLLTHHDHARFHVTCYSSVVRPDEVTARLRAASDDWRDVATLSDFQLADLIRDDQIDLLVDCSGHTLGNRLQAFGLAPAPVQLTYLGYPNTTGVPTIQYRLTDPLADPPGLTDPLHTETLLRLPRTAWCYQPPADAPPVQHSEFTIQNSPLTFGSFNTFSKITDDTIALWSAALLATPNSRLLIKAKALADAPTRQLAADRFAAHGIAPDRLDLLPWDPSVTHHLSTYARVDIALDTYPYHGTTTTCEALLMGVPVVTLAGPTHASRVGVSLLTSAGLPDLIATTPDEFAATASRLAADRPRLTHLHNTLRHQLLSSPLCDAPAFAHDVESAYRQVWANWCASRPAAG